MDRRGSAKRSRQLALAVALGVNLAACGASYNKAGPLHGVDEDRFCQEGMRPGPDFFDPNCYGGIGI